MSLGTKFQPKQKTVYLDQIWPKRVFSVKSRINICTKLTRDFSGKSEHSVHSFAYHN